MTTMRFAAICGTLSFLMGCSLLSPRISTSRADEPPSWLHGSGDDLEVVLRGEVFEPDGSPAEGVSVDGSLRSHGKSTLVRAECEGHHFAARLPVNRTSWYSMQFRVASKSGAVGYVKMTPDSLRQAAIDGKRVTLARPTRRVAVTVEHAGSPVAGAQVRADLGYNVELHTVTDADGVACFDLLPDQKLSSFTAWTDDRRVGGYQFGRKPTRNADEDSHVVELFDCRDLTIRFVDGEGNPVEGVAFEFQVATPAPNYNYLGLVEPRVLTTDEQGEAFYRWQPDWEQYHYYPEIVEGTGWILAGSNSDHEESEGAIVYRVKPAAERHTVAGRVEPPAGVEAGGFFVQVRSFQGEQEGFSDHLSAIADSQGAFSVDVLPGATYCACVNDAGYTGKMIDLVPYEPATDCATEIVLPVVAGEELSFSVTRGPQRVPYEGVGISVRETYRYTWWEDDEKQSGTGSRDRWLTTDESGRAVTRVLPGEIKARVIEPLWQVGERIEVKQGEPAHLSLHRERETLTPVAGRLVLAGGAEGELAGAQVRFGAVDGAYDHTGSTTASHEGTFEFETLGEQLGVFAVSADQKLAGATFAKRIDEPLQVEMKPTREFRGRLLDGDDTPRQGYSVWAVVRVEGDEDYDGRFVKSTEAARYQTVTNDRGEFVFEHLPTEIEIALESDNLPEDEDPTAYLGEVYLTQNETRPPAVYHLERRAAAPTKPLAERFAESLRDARISDCHFMAIACGEADHLANFMQLHFTNYEKNPVVSRYIQCPIYLQADGQGARLLEERGWAAPEGDAVHAWALDGDGNLLGELKVDAAKDDAGAAADAFVAAHAPEAPDAEEKWRHALADAAATDRQVWARVSGRYCGPCFMLSRWIDDQCELLEKDYVFVKVDRVTDTHGPQIAKLVTNGKSYGIPFHAIFSPDGKRLEESIGPLGNIGYPSTHEGKLQLRKMLDATRIRLTDEEVDQLIESL
ncbi:hypothetical protein Pla123a_32910 [Posidoniimonas polymericola]|uniref:Nickel uptake substrate-specific transmembrane region n=1 Tax=Posidoniimonas polymericola TaxID=2528002 RepID=A0A5C5YH15_9BACT|nr:thioredoxin family protein [Posidoniimonas polymericola]TWT74468.1 hypothetical protein Pla123a_32910 [Posidoniimonas polymericola]